MASGANEVVVTWKDRLGRVARVVFFVAKSIVDPKDPVIVGLIALIEKIARAKATLISLGGSESFSGTAGTGFYSTSEDKAQMSVLDADGKSHNWKIPGITPEILEADHETINPADASGFVAKWVGDVHTYVAGQGGAAMTATFQGKRLMRKRLKH